MPACHQPALTAQWDPGKGRFVINNIGAKGGSQEFTRQQIEQGEIYVNVRDKSTVTGTRMMKYRIQHQSPIISLKGS